MPRFPLRIPVPPYSGANESRRQKYLDAVGLARRIEEYINGRQESGRSKQMFPYSSIAHDLGVVKEEVRKLLQPVGHGRNGITMDSGAVDDGDLD
jgi:hypothetical protein